MDNSQKYPYRNYAINSLIIHLLLPGHLGYASNILPNKHLDIFSAQTSIICHQPTFILKI